MSVLFDRVKLIFIRQALLTRAVSIATNLNVENNCVADWLAIKIPANPVLEVWIRSS